MLKKAVSLGLETTRRIVTVTAVAFYRGDVSLASWSRRARRLRLWLRARICETHATIWDLVYSGAPPWEIGRPQLALLAAADSGEIHGSVLDVGCGTGELVLFLRKRGYDIGGIDISPRAIASARRKARAQNIDDAIFCTGDAFALAALGRTFDTVIEGGLFHCLEDSAQRTQYARSLASITRPGGALFILAISDREPSDYDGPNRIAESDFRQAFDEGWNVAYVRPAKYETSMDRHATAGGAEAWLARMDRTDDRSGKSN